jgi:NTE family protein
VFAAGGTVEDLAAYVVGATPRAEFEPLATLIRAADERRPFLNLSGLRHLADVRRLVAGARHLGRGHFAAAFAAAVPGLVEIVRRFDFLDAAPAPTNATPAWRIVAADRRGARHVLTSGTVPLSLAVAESCAVPGVFAPVDVGGHQLVDGAVSSSTHADLAIADGSEIVIVLAPMVSRPLETGAPSPATVALASESAVLGAAGRSVVTFHPSNALLRLMGRNPLATARAAAITSAAFLEACDGLGDLPPRRRRAA